MTIISLNLLDDLIKIAVELGEGKKVLSPEELQHLRIYISSFTPEQHAKFMMCEYVLACVGDDMGVIPATESQKNIMVLMLTGKMVA